MIGGVNAAAVQLGNDFSNVYVDNAHEMVNMYGAAYASVASGAGGTVQIGGGAVVVVTAGSVTINGGAVSETACANYVAIASSNGTVASGSAISLPTAPVVHLPVAWPRSLLRACTGSRFRRLQPTTSPGQPTSRRRGPARSRFV